MMLLFLVFFPMAAAVCSYLIGRKDKKLRDHAVQIFCLIEFAVAAAAMGLVVAGKELSAAIPGFCGFGLSFQLDGFRALYALVAGVMWLMTSLLSGDYFAHHYRNRNRYYFFFLLTQGATVGVFLSADLFTTFIFFEIMSFTSYTWVAHDETPGAMRAAETYLAVAIIGGMVMLMGLFLLWNAVGTLTISELYEAAKACPRKGTIWAASICILFGFGAKAGMFPLHIWLPKAHPVAPAPASALLSGILTKSGIFGVIVVSANIFRASTAWGNMLLVLGLITMLGGAVLAVFSINLKRTLACSSMSQIGFILTGIAMGCLLGEENALAARGALLYMVNHSLFKLVLFMAAGVVYMNLHKLNLNDVRGFGRKKPILHFAFLMGAVGLMGVPGFSGYVSKTLIHEGIVEYAELLAEEGMGALALLYRGAEWIYLFSGGRRVYDQALHLPVLGKAPDAADCLRSEKAVYGQALRAGAPSERGDCAGAGAHAEPDDGQNRGYRGRLPERGRARARGALFLADQHQGRLHLADNRPVRVSDLHPHEADEGGERRTRIRRSLAELAGY